MYTAARQVGRCGRREVAMLSLIRRHWRSGAKVGVLGTALVVGAIMFSTAGAPPAQAELQNPRQTWLRQSQAGLFLHWGMRTSPVFTSCSAWQRSEEHTSELQSRPHLVCRLLLEKK